MFKDLQQLALYIASMGTERDVAIFQAEQIIKEKKEELKQAQKDLEKIINYYNQKLGVV